ncbi:MAG: glycosyltransferase family 4 protein [Desulfobacteraceae bacterium]
MIRVMHMITDLDTGGAEMMLCKLLSALDPDQFSCRVVSLSPPGALGVRIRELGIGVETLGLTPQSPNPWALIKGIRMLRQWRPHIVQTWMYHADLVGTVAGMLANRGLLIWNIRCVNMELTHYRKSTRCVLWACRALSHCPVAVVTNSYASMAHHRRMGYPAKHFRVIPNGFDLERFRPDSFLRRQIREELEIHEDTPVVGLVARFDPMKDHGSFFSAAQRVEAQAPETHFVLCGEGVIRDNPACKVFLDKLENPGKVHLLGRREDINRIMAGFDILVLTSAYGESFPNVIGEAMACGVPCVVTDVGDSAKIVADTGRVVPPRDPRAMAKAILDLLRLPVDRRYELGACARERIRRRYSLDGVADAYERLYTEVAACRSNPG